jgi:hypothetical protein
MLIPKIFVIKCVLNWDAYLNGCVLKWEAIVLDASDVQTTINLLQQCITQSAEEVFGNRQVALGKAIKHSHKPWFDTECRQTKSQFTKLSHAHPHRQVRLKQMKQLYKRKKRAYDVLKAKQLCGLAKADPASF